MAGRVIILFNVGLYAGIFMLSNAYYHPHFLLKHRQVRFFKAMNDVKIDKYEDFLKEKLGEMGSSLFKSEVTKFGMDTALAVGLMEVCS
jgi:hypothetical protein